METYIIKQIKEKIEVNKIDWANNYISREANSELDTEEAKKNVSSAEFNMDAITKRIEWLETKLKSLE